MNELLNKINEAIENGLTVRIATVYQYTDVNKQTVDKFRKAGLELFKATENGLYMRRGKSWDCIRMASGGNSVQITAY